jgi:osmoprotectant transport system ATP-binding protein
MIRVKNICKSWDDGETFTVRDASFEVAPGSVMALLGGSGSGKSTIVQMINRLYEITSGTIEIDGDDIQTLDAVTLRRGIGYVFQEIGLFPHRTVAQNVGMIPKLLGQAPDVYEAKVTNLLEMVELPRSEFGDRLPSQLSGGQRQRVGFARALAGDPKVMLLDEPFGALDPVTRDNLQTSFQALQKKLGFTAVLVTHDMAEALLLADTIAVMKEGEILRIGTPADLLKNPGDPYVTQLLETPRRHGKLIQDLERDVAS